MLKIFHFFLFILFFVSVIFELKSVPIEHFENSPLTESLPLHVPSLEKVAQLLKAELSSNFEHVEVAVVNCPDLTKKPFSLAAAGLNGKSTIVEVGSESYLLPTPIKSKVYDIKDIKNKTGVSPMFIIGAGSGPFPYVGVSSEYIANSFVYGDGRVHSLSQIAKVVKEDNSFLTETLPDDVTTFAFMGNFLVSEGKPGKVLKVHCSKRIGEDDFVTALKKGLGKEFSDKAVGMGGTFLITNSRVKQHVQQDFSETPLVTQEQRDKWLNFYDMNPPLVAVGNIITYDPGLSLRLFHFHSLSDHNEAGHYHYDLDPDTVDYLGYFTFCNEVVRIDRPPLKLK